MNHKNVSLAVKIFRKNALIQTYHSTYCKIEILNTRYWKRRKISNWN